MTTPKKPRVKITVRGAFGPPGTVEGTILGEITEGYDLPSGAWCRYPSDGATPAVFLKYRPKGKRLWRAVNKKDVLKIESVQEEKP